MIMRVGVAPICVESSVGQCSKEGIVGVDLDLRASAIMQLPA